MQPTVLTAVPGDLVDSALSVLVALVCHVLLDAPSEEALRRHGDKVYIFAFPIITYF